MATHSGILACEIPWTGAWQDTVPRVTKESDTTQQLDNNSSQEYENTDYSHFFQVRAQELYVSK